MKPRAKILSLFMAMVLVLGMSPYAAWAEEDTSINGDDAGSATIDAAESEALAAGQTEPEESQTQQPQGDGNDQSAFEGEEEPQAEDDEKEESDSADPSDLLVNDASTEFNSSAPYVDGEILVVYQQAGDSIDSEGLTSDQMLEEAKVDLNDNGCVDAPETTAALELVNLQAVEQVADSGASEGMTVVAEIEDGKSVEQAVQDAATVPGVAYAQPNYIYQSLGDLTDVVNDSQAGQQQYLESMGVARAWSAAKSDNQVTVAVLDTGCRLDHEDLQANLLSSLAYDAYNNVLLDEAGIANNGDASGHGTAVAGIIAAQANNEVGIVGASFNANILPVKVFSDDASSPTATTADVIEGIDYVASVASAGSAPGLRVVNMSFGFYGADESDHSLQSAIASLRSNYGIVCVCAGGNGSGGSAVYPADYPETISVASLNQDGAYSAWADLAGKDVAAVGEGVCATLASSAASYGAQDGSSASAAMVSGVAALLFASDPGLSADQVESALRDGASGIEGQDGPGALNACGSLNCIGVSIAEEDEGQAAETADSEGGEADSSKDEAEPKSDEGSIENEGSDSEEAKDEDASAAQPSDQGLSQLTFSEASQKKQGPENSWRFTNGIPNPSFSVLTYTPSDSKGKGIDISQWQGDIDWAKVKASGIKFAIIRCGYGDNYSSQDDYKFARNVSECERLGIPYGVYIYSYAVRATGSESATSEAEHVIRLLKGHKPSYPVYIDIEDNSVRGCDLNVVAETFCKKIAAAGYKPGVYASLSWWNDYLTSSNLDKYDKWVAQWNVQCDYKKTCGLWQYSDRGSVPGISGYVDMDYAFKSYTSSGSSSTTTTTTTTTKPARTVSDGVYTIASKLNTAKALEVKGASTSNGANIQLYSKNKCARQTFKFKYQSDGYYSIKNIQTSKVLEVKGGSSSNGANIQQATWTGSDSQRWKVKKNSDGSYTLANKASGKVVDVAEGKTANGTNIQQYKSNGTNAQKFVIKSAKHPKAIAGGTYKIVSSSTSTRVLAVKGNSKASAANVLLAKSGSTSQKFKLEYNNTTGFYTITNVNSGKRVELKGGSVNNKSNIQQATASSSLRQRWVIEKSGSYYVISSAYNPAYSITLAGSNTKAGTNAWLYKWSGSKYQKFALKKV